MTPIESAVLVDDELADERRMTPIESAVLVDDELAAAVDLRGTGIVVLHTLAHHCVHVVPAPVEMSGIAPEVVVLVDDSSVLAGVGCFVFPLVVLVDALTMCCLVLLLVLLVDALTMCFLVLPLVVLVDALTMCFLVLPLVVLVGALTLSCLVLLLGFAVPLLLFRSTLATMAFAVVESGDPAWHAWSSDFWHTWNGAPVGCLAVEHTNHVVCLQCSCGSSPGVGMSCPLLCRVFAGPGHFCLRRGVGTIIQEGTAASLELRERLGADSNSYILCLVAVVSGGVGCLLGIRLATLGGVVCCQPSGVAVLSQVHSVEQILGIPGTIRNFFLGTVGELATSRITLALLEHDFDLLGSLGKVLVDFLLKRRSNNNQQRCRAN